jgi:hypothetical protein
VSKFKKISYGIKQLPRMWYQTFHTYILNLAFVRSKVDHYVYSKEEGGFFIYVSLHVKDMLLVGEKMHIIKEVKMQFPSKFNIKHLSAVKFIMGMEIERDRVVRKLCLNPRKYIETILKIFNMLD